MMTMSKLATIAHVSVSTVSKAFSMSPEVNDETREMIFEIAKKHGCFKKFYTAKYPRYVIAVICPEFQSRYYANSLSLIQKRLAEHNCEVCVAATEFSKESKNSLLQYYDKYTDVDGIITIDTNIETSSDIDLPIVSISSRKSLAVSISVLFSYDKPIKEAIRYFKSKNVDKIGFIGETYTLGKKNKFIEAMLENFGYFDEELISTVDKRFEEGGYLAMKKLIDKGTIPRAILCSYDNMAIGAISCIYENGLSVPDDVAVLGINDIEESKYLNPPLSSINPHIDTICDIAVNAIMDKLSGRDVNSTVTVEPTLYLRKSTEIY